MFKRFKRSMLYALCLTLVLAMLPAGGLAEADKPTLTIGVPDHPNVIDWETNEQTLHIEEKLGVNLDFVKYPYKDDEYLQKLELNILAGGKELPDVLMLTISDMAQLQLYGEMGMFVALNDYMDDTPYLDEHLASLTANPITKEDYIKYITCADGNIYGFGTCNTTVNNSVSAGRIMIYEPWMNAYLEASGLEEVTTTEQFKDMLMYFRDNDMNGNGDATDEIPLLGYKDVFMANLLRQLMNPFVYTQEHYYYNDNGTIRFAATMDGWKDGLKYIKSLFDEGLISTLTLTQDSTQFNAIVTAETTTVGAVARFSVSNMASTDPRREEYVITGALEGPTGLRQVSKYPNLPSIRFTVSKNCENVEMAVKLADYLCSIEMGIWSRYGKEGEQWKYLTGDEIGVSQYASMGYQGDIVELNPIWGSSQNIHWNQTGLTILDGSEMTLRLATGVAEGVYDSATRIGEGILKELNYANTENAVFGLVFTAEEQETVTEYRSTINDYVAEMVAQFVTGTTDIDAGWDAYLSELEKMGLSQYLSAVQSCWDRMQG